MTAVVVGNPKPASRTLDASQRLHHALTGEDPDVVIDVIDLGADLLGWEEPSVKEAVEAVRTAGFVVVASPTFKATYTGLLKLFLDQFATSDGLRDVVAVPMMLGAGPGHAMAPEHLLKPVLVELGATVPVPGLYLNDKSYVSDGVMEAYSERWRIVVERARGMEVTR